MRTKTLWTRGAGLALAALIVAGCGGGSGGSISTTADGSSGSGLRVEAEREAAGKAAEGGSAGLDSKSGAEGGGSPEQARAQPANLAPDDREIIFTASLTVKTKDVSAAVSDAERMVRGAGGFVYGQHITTDRDGDQHTEADLTLKVPPEEFRDVLGRLGSDLGTLQESQQDAKDVTGKVADVESRVKSAKASIARLRSLLDQADTVGEVLQVEEKLSARESELESLQAQAESLAKKTSYGTVTLHLVGPENKPAPPPEEPDGPTGFVGGLFAGWGAFTTIALGLFTAIGAMLPFLAVLGVLGFAAWWIRGQVRQRRALPAPDTAGPGGDAPA